MITQEQVHGSLRNAADNGCNFDGWDAESIAVDLMMFDAAFEKAEIEEVVAHIEAWLNQPPATSGLP